MLPGALPPRGPPKAGGEGPNKAVSKLQLLICGNDYIRQLKGRVERRDEEIGRLRGEVRRVRDVVRGLGGEVDEGEFELERDLDLGEVISLARGESVVPEGDEDGEEDGED